MNLQTNNRDQHFNIRASNLAFLRSPSERNIRVSGQQLSNLLTDQIFLRGLNNSYIGQISGVKQQIKEINHQDLLPPIEEQELTQNDHKHKRINFSAFRGVATSKIIKSDNALNQDEEKQLQTANKEILRLRSFVGSEKTELFTPNSCGLCSYSPNSNKVRVLLLNMSTLQIYCQTEESKSTENYNQLVFSLNFDTAKAEVYISNLASSQQLVISVGDYRVILQHDSRAVIKDWFKRLQAMQLQSKGKQFNMRKTPSIKEFYQRRYQTQEFFVNNCQTGDVILFQDDHFFAKVQRFLTRSNFDHVAMVIRDQNYGILLFESNSGTGVSLTPWRSMIRYGWYQNIPRIAWRRLEVQRNTQFNTGVQKFVKQNLQKNYHISFEKLLSAHSYIRPAATNNSPQGKKQQQEGYFCSELVATIYKELGLLTRDTSRDNYQPACKFYPKDFSQKSGRKLDKGQLSPEYDIFFDKNALKQRYKHLIRD